VQADELWVKLVGRRMWLAMALAVPSRLWLGVLSARSATWFGGPCLNCSATKCRCLPGWHPSVGDRRRSGLTNQL
jgi:hypothetical protein